MMKLTQLFLKNFTIFSEFTLEFSPGINVLIGQNGVGKTHILKILYAACKTSKLAESLPYNLVKTFRPEDGSLDPLMHRGVPKVSPTIVRVSTPDATLECAFSSGAIYQDAPVIGLGAWRSQGEIRSFFFPAKDLLSHVPLGTKANIARTILDLDDTQIDMMIQSAIQKTPGTQIQDDAPEEAPEGGQFPRLKTVIRKKRHCLKRNNTVAKFTMTSSGCIKIGMLKKFMDNGVLDNIDILYWDAPDADLDPGMIPLVVDVLLKLVEAGVQIFLATNNCLFVRYLQARTDERHAVRYHSLYADKYASCSICTSGTRFSRVKETPIERDFFHLIDTISKSEMERPADFEEEEERDEAAEPEMPEPPLSSKLRI